jgi:hypothetical protein
MAPVLRLAKVGRPRALGSGAATVIVERRDDVEEIGGERERR